MPEFKEFDDKYLQCRNCGECVNRPERDVDYGSTPDTHECRNYDETGGIPARGF